jgi:hypothetical protein
MLTITDGQACLFLVNVPAAHDRRVPRSRLRQVPPHLV